MLKTPPLIGRAVLFVVLLSGSAAHAQESPPALHPVPHLIERAAGQATEAVTVEIEGYARVVPARDSLRLPSERGIGERGVERDLVLSYATNRAVGQQLVVTVSGLPPGAVLVIEPVAGSLDVERIARGGSPGTPVGATVPASGDYVLLEGVGQVVAHRAFRLTATAASATGSGAIRLAFRLEGGSGDGPAAEGP